MKIDQNMRRSEIEQDDAASLFLFPQHSAPQRIHFHDLLGDPLVGPLFRTTPKIGLVIGTYGSPAYVHLHLEARRRFYPHVPVLVHDDASPEGERLAALCEDYGVDFECNGERSGHSRGDLSVFIGGLRWASLNGIDLMVKMSRRFIPLDDWTESLSALAVESQYVTYSSWTETWGFGFRTECLGIAVRPWFDLGLQDHLVAKYLSGSDLLMEVFMHDLARHAAARNCAQARSYDERVGQRPSSRNGYAVWDYLGFDRMSLSSRFLWHNATPPYLYFELAERWGLPWEEGHFQPEV